MKEAHDAARIRVAAVSGLTDIGKARAENQDAWHADRAAGVCFVADGMGGMAAGGAASQALAQFLPARVKAALGALAKDGERRVKAALAGAIAALSAEMRERAAKEPALKGMGSTVVLALARGDRLYIAHAGDSRAYLMRRGEFRWRTRDHSVVAVMLEFGKLTPEEAAKHPLRGKLSRYIGQDGAVVPEVHALVFKGPARLLLCSDGLTGMVPDKAIAAALREESAPEGACRRLVNAALDAGGNDNVTVLVADLERGG